MTETQPINYAYKTGHYEQALKQLPHTLLSLGYLNIDNEDIVACVRSVVDDIISNAGKRERVYSSVVY